MNTKTKTQSYIARATTNDKYDDDDKQQYYDDRHNNRRLFGKNVGNINFNKFE